MSSPRVSSRAAPRRISVSKRSPLLTSPFTAYTAPEHQSPPEDYGRLYAKELLRPTHQGELNLIIQKHDEQIDALKKTLGLHGGRESRTLLAKYDKEARSSYTALEASHRREKTLVKLLYIVILIFSLYGAICVVFPWLAKWVALVIVLEVFGAVAVRQLENRQLFST